MNNPNDTNNKNKKFTIEDMKINDNLRELCKEEDLIIIEKEKEEEEKRKYKKMGFDPLKKLTIYIYTENKDDNENNKKIIKNEDKDIDKEEKMDDNDLNEEIKYNVKTITLIGKDKYEKLLEEIYKIYNYPEKIQKIIKIREFDPHQKKIKDYIDIDKKEFIGKIFSNKDTSLFIQFPINEEGTYPIYEPFKINVYVIQYPDNNKDDFSLDNLPKKKITIQTTDSLDNLTKKICEKIGYNYEEKNINIIKKILTYDTNDYFQINKNDLYSDKTIAMELILNNAELYVEKIKDNEKSKWDEYLDKFRPQVMITFNNINPNIPQKELSIFCTKSEVMLNVKKEIINTLNNPIEYNMNNIIMKENNKNGKEIIDLNLKLNNYTSFNTYKLYIEKGIPLKNTEKELVIFFCEFNYDKFNFYPYKFTPINSKLIIDENKTIKDLKNIIIENDMKNFPEIKKIFNENENKIIIRKINGQIPSKIFYDDQIIKKIIEEDYDLCNTIRFCIQFIPNNLIDYENININTDSNNSFEVSMRYFDFSTWKLTEPLEVIIKNDITYEKLCDIILKHYPNLEAKDNIQIIKLTGGYKVYLDTMLKFQPYSLIDYLDSKIDKYPLFLINEGKMLIIKDKRIEAAEPNEEIKNYGFEPLDEKNKNKNEIEYANSRGKVQQMIALFNKGEFDPAKKIHTDPNYKKNIPRVKEKGISIKIKMLEKDDKNNDNNDENKKNEIEENQNYNNDTKKDNKDINVKEENNINNSKTNIIENQKENEICYYNDFDESEGIEPLI